MNRRSLQAGMSFWQLSIVIAVVIFFGVVGMKMLPLYLNDLKVQKAVKSVAQNPQMSKASPHEIRKALQKHWDIEDITRVKVAEIKLLRTKQGTKVLSYDYEAIQPIFYNVSVLINFAGEEALGVGGDGG